MSFKKSPLYSNPYIDQIENPENWIDLSSKSVKCTICDGPIPKEAYKLETGFGCPSCVVANINYNIINAEQVADITLSELRKAMSQPNNLRWHLFLVFHFEKIYNQENEINQYALKVLLIEQLAYVKKHPLSQEIRQLAFNECLYMGDEILELAKKLYRRKPWQFQVNIFLILMNIAPHSKDISIMAKDAAKHKEIEARKIISAALTTLNCKKYPWVHPILIQLCRDPDQSIRELAKKYINSKPLNRNNAKIKQENKTSMQMEILADDDISNNNILHLYHECQSKQTYKHITIEEMISALYTADNLKKIMSALIIPFLREQELIGDDPKTIYKLNKIKSVAIFAYILLDDKLLPLFVNTLPADVKKVLETFVWEGSIRDILSIEKELNVTIMSEADGRNRYANTSIKPEFLIFQIDARYDSWHDTYQGKIQLHNELKTIFKPHIPMPETAVLKSVNRLPDNHYTYSDNNKFAYQVNLFLEYARQGNLKYTKDGHLTKTTIKKFNKYFNIIEFYPEGESALLYLYSNLLMDFLVDIKPFDMNLGKIENVKKIILDFFQWENFKNYQFIDYLPHLYGSCYSGPEIEINVREYFFELLKSLNDYSWISLDNLCSHVKCNSEKFYYAEHQEVLSSLYMGVQFTAYNAYSSNWSNIHDNFNQIFLLPYLKGMFYLFAILGLVDIAYDDPKNNNYHIQEKEYLTLYDGLLFVKLNEFGKYVFDLPHHYEIKAAEELTKVTLDDKRLIVKIEGEGRLEEMVLKRFAIPIGKNLYKISYESFLHDCHSIKDIQTNIKIFKEKISSKFPSIWLEFFNDIESKINPLSLQDDIQVYKISPGKELISLIARDEILKQYILKVENHHIAIEMQNLDKVKKRLREFGFFIDCNS